MNMRDLGLSVTLSEKLFDQLNSESARLAIPLEWLVASLLVEMASEEGPANFPHRNTLPG